MIALILIMTFTVPITISQRETSGCLETTKNDDSADAVILTVCNKGRGMTALPQLRLYFRLSQSGRVEYEINSEHDPQAGEANHILVLRETKIDVKEVAEIVKLGKESDFQDAKAEYPGFQTWDDSGLETTIIFKNQVEEKKIVVNNYSSYDVENVKHYPLPLLKMLQKIDELRPKVR